MDVLFATWKESGLHLSRIYRWPKGAASLKEAVDLVVADVERERPLADGVQVFERPVFQVSLP